MLTESSLPVTQRQVKEPSHPGHTGPKRPPKEHGKPGRHDSLDHELVNRPHPPQAPPTVAVVYGPISETLSIDSVAPESRG